MAARAVAAIASKARREYLAAVSLTLLCSAMASSVVGKCVINNRRESGLCQGRVSDTLILRLVTAWGYILSKSPELWGGVAGDWQKPDQAGPVKAGPTIVPEQTQ